eukprot:Nk52_evm6s359 gene=Nk52_evmTU6s359
MKILSLLNYPPDQQQGSVMNGERELPHYRHEHLLVSTEEEEEEEEGGGGLGDQGGVGRRRRREETDIRGGESCSSETSPLLYAPARRLSSSSACSGGRVLRGSVEEAVMVGSGAGGGGGGMKIVKGRRIKHIYGRDLRDVRWMTTDELRMIVKTIFFTVFCFGVYSALCLYRGPFTTSQISIKEYLFLLTFYLGSGFVLTSFLLPRFLYFCLLHIFSFCFLLTFTPGLHLEGNDKEIIVLSITKTLVNFPDLYLFIPFVYFAGASTVLQDIVSIRQKQPHYFSWFAKLFPSNSKKILFFNYLGYFLPFCIGMHINFLVLPSIGLLPPLEFSYESFSKWSVSRIVSVSLISVAVLILVAYHFYVIWKHGRFVVYVTCYSIYSAILVGISFVVSPEFEFHFHHYFNACLLIPLTRYSDLCCALTQGFLAGYAFQGYAVYGSAVNWEPKSPGAASQFNSGFGFV